MGRGDESDVLTKMALLGRMEDGGWRMEDGGWRMENGEWRMENGTTT
jgi:hypothetical protein